MPLFKKKPAMFGANIPESCEYCFYSTTEGGKIICPKNAPKTKKGCKLYLYDPTKREPKAERSLEIKEYSKDDFEL